MILWHLLKGAPFLACLSFGIAHAATGELEQPFRDLFRELTEGWSLNHEGAPLGVPRGYSWARWPEVQAGNTPGGFGAMTGWGQVFWAAETIGHPGNVQIRNLQTFICSGERWERVQIGSLEGAEYRADFKNDESRPARYVVEGSVATVAFDAGRVFHFWPKGRVRLPDGALCGVVVLLEARAVAVANGLEKKRGGYLIGAGADYWVDMASAWDRFKTNKGVGVGRLRYLGDKWTWYGMSTASDGKTDELFRSGLVRVDGVSE